MSLLSPDELAKARAKIRAADGVLEPGSAGRMLKAITRWNHQTYGSELDPVRQSDMNQLTSSFGCPKRFEFQKVEDAAGNGRTPERAYAMRCLGTAVHGVIARALWSFPTHVLNGRVPADDILRRVLDEEMDKAAEGLPLEWGKKKPATELSAGVAMARGVLETLPEYASEIVLVEAPFVVEVPSKSKRPVFGRGTIDLIYRDHDGRLCFCDWKTGAMKPDVMTLDHGYQIAMYSTAVHLGRLEDPRLGAELERVRSQGLEAAERRGSGLGAFVLGERPAAAHIVHCRDFVPYTRKGKRTANELDAGWRGLAKGDVIAYEKGDRRGRGWYASKRTASDDARFAVSISTIVGTVRLGRFFEMIGEGCRRCPYKGRCLTEGHEMDADAQRALNKALGADDEDGLI